MFYVTLENLHILVVDDEEHNRELLLTFLEGSGAQVTCCEDGEYAYHKTTVHSYDCIVSDIHMPNMGGLEFLSKIRYILKCNTPLIMISGDAELTHSEITLKGAQGFLRKPFPLQTLKDMILGCKPAIL
jgi:CheY-like chemotaxis protein